MFIMSEPHEPSARDIVIDYTNWKGVRAIRTIRPLDMWFGRNEYHMEPQFLLRAMDVDNQEVRDFAMASIHSWTPANAEMAG